MSYPGAKAKANRERQKQRQQKKKQSIFKSNATNIYSQSVPQSIIHQQQVRYPPINLNNGPKVIVQQPQIPAQQFIYNQQIPQQQVRYPPMNGNALKNGIQPQPMYAQPISQKPISNKYAQIPFPPSKPQNIPPAYNPYYQSSNQNQNQNQNRAVLASQPSAPPEELLYPDLKNIYHKQQ